MKPRYPTRIEKSVNKKTILFTIELADRELLAKCLLATEMVKLGFRVYIGTFRSIHEIRKKLNSCIFFHKSAYKRRMQQYKREMGATIAILDEEAGIAIPSRMVDDFCRNRYESLNKDSYDYVFTIGDGYTSRLQSMPNMAGINVISTGWPRIDLWREEYSGMHSDRISELKKEHGDYLLFVSSFGFTSKEGYEYQLSRASYDEDIKTLHNVYSALQNYIDLLKNLATDGTQNIIVRPHTSESIEEWRSIFKDYPNIKVIRQGDITPWLLAASGVITYRSTVNVQAALNGIPTVQYKINEIDGINDLAVFKVSKCAETVDEVKSYLTSFKTTQDKERLKQEAADLLSQDVSSLTGTTAASKIASILAQVDLQPQPEIKLHPALKALSYGWDRYKYLEHKTRKILFKKKSGYRLSRFEKIPNGITAGEINLIVNSLQSAQSTESIQIHFEQTSNNLVMLEQKHK